MALPLSTPLSQLLVAFTIEFDNEFERRFAEAGIGRRFGISLVMWSNFMRFVGDGITVGELPVAAGLPKPRVLSTLGGMERWRYVFVSPEPDGEPPSSKREGWGSARALRREWFVRPTSAGRKAVEIWQPLLGEIEARWEERFGADEIRGLRQSLAGIVEQLELGLPEYLPIVSGSNGMAAEIVRREGPASDVRGAALSTLLAQVLLAYTIDFESSSEVSLPLSANVLRVVANTGLDLGRIPSVAGVSKEAVSMALTFLAKRGLAAVEAELPAKIVHLTPTGREARDAARAVHEGVEERWRAQFGADCTTALRAGLERVLEQRDGARPRLSLGLVPHPDGWRASKPYREQTNAVLEDPVGRLPHYPMVLHRGGWPDGS